MRLFAEKSELVGVTQNTFHMVHEGFWDLYCKKPSTADLTAKKLEGWLNRINLKVPSWPAPEEEEDADATPPGLPVKAVVRVRIPFKKPEPVEGEAEAEAAASEKKSEDATNPDKGEL